MAPPTDVASAGADELVARFERAAIAYGVAASRDEEEDAERDWQVEMHRLDRVKWAIAREVWRRGPEAEAAFLRLLAHAEPYVRAEAATAAIHFAPNAATPVLLEIGARRGPIGFYARKVLGYHRAALAGLATPPPDPRPG